MSAAACPPASTGTYLRMLMQPFPLVRKNMLLSLFQEISFTSNLNCSSALERCVLASMKVTTSSLFPTAMVCPSGLQQMLMFSPGGTESQQVPFPPSHPLQPRVKQTGSFYSPLKATICSTNSKPLPNGKDCQVLHLTDKPCTAAVQKIYTVIKN